MADQDEGQGLNTVVIAVLVTGSIVVVAIIAMMAVVVHWRYHMMHKSGRNHSQRHSNRRGKLGRHENDIYTYRSSSGHNPFDPYILESYDNEYSYRGTSEFSSHDPHILDGYSFYKG